MTWNAFQLVMKLRAVIVMRYQLGQKRQALDDERAELLRALRKLDPAAALQELRDDEIGHA